MGDGQKLDWLSSATELIYTRLAESCLTMEANMVRDAASTIPVQPKTHASASAEDTSTNDSPFLARWLFWLLVAVILVCVLGVGIFYWLSESKDELNMEFAKAGLQIGVISLAGTALSYLVSRYEKRFDTAQRERELEAEAARIAFRFREDFLKETLKRIIASYNKSKGARRMARAALIPAADPTHVRLPAYDKCIADVNDAQLELEAVRRDLETSKDPAAERYVKEMERYLNKIVDEYEKGRSKSTDSDIALTDVKTFHAFVNPKDKKNFDGYAKMHDGVRDAIHRELFALTSRTSRSSNTSQGGSLFSAST